MASRTGFTHEVNKAAEEKNVECFTPPGVFDVLGVEFDVDVASPGAGAVPWLPARRFLTIREDGRKADWGTGLAFMNHPYGWDDLVWGERFTRHPDGISLTWARMDTRMTHLMLARCHAFSCTKGRMEFVGADWKPIGAGAGAGSIFFARGERAVAALRRAEGRAVKKQDGTASFVFGSVLQKMLV